MNANGAIAAMKAFKEAMDGNVVTAEELLRRQRICNRCPKKRRDVGVKTAISRMIGNIANKHRVPEEVKGFSCGVCGCSLMLLLPATKKDLHVDNAEEAKERPDSCWIKTA
jgi:hypothetical protein